MPATAEGENGNAVTTEANGYATIPSTRTNGAKGEAQQQATTATTNAKQNKLKSSANGEEKTNDVAKPTNGTVNGNNSTEAELLEDKQGGGGVGATPAGAGAAMAQAAQALPLLEPKNLRILVVDSDNDSSNGTCNVLQDCGYNVVAVKTSKQAFEELEKVSVAAADHNNSSGEEKKSFDIILKEHEPPKSDACRMLKKIWNHKTYRNIPIVVTSNRYESNTIQKCLQFGAADYMLKPLRPQEARTLWVRVWRRLVAMQFDPNQNLNWNKQMQAEMLQLRESGANGQNGADQQSLSGMSTQSDADVDGDSHEGSNPNDQNERKQMNGEQDNNNNSDEQPRTHDHIHGGTNDRVGRNTNTLHLLHDKMNKGQQNTTSNGLGTKSMMTASAFQAFNSPWNQTWNNQTTSKRKEMEGNGDSNGNGNGSNGKNAASNVIGPQHGNGNSNGNGSNGHNGGNGHESNGASSRHILPKAQHPREMVNQSKKMKLQQDQTNSVHPFSMNNNGNMTITPFGPMPSHLAQSVFWGMAAQQEMNYLTAMQWNGVPSAQAALAAAAANAANAASVQPTGQQQQQDKQAQLGKESKKSLQKDSEDGSGKTTSTQTAADSIAKESTSAERRAAALDKFRQKKKTLCFSKKIRYASRKQLAEARPRIKGQFVKTDSSGSKETNNIATEDNANKT